MDFVVIISFLTTSIALTLAPGPDIIFVIAQSISQDIKAGITTACGLCTGLLVHITAAAIGVSAVIYQSSAAFSFVKYAGAVYLLYLAWKAFRNKEQAIFSARSTSVSHYKDLYKKGIIMNLLNPKVSLFFLALLPQFTDASDGPIALQMLLLGFIFLTQALIIFLTVSILAHKASQFIRNNPNVSRQMNIIQGVLFTLIGLQLLLPSK
ncbi:threonine/homoserine/homoserine lactone efflux protein [Salibacterium salarium]|uniref:LysE family translocator n=1 Tax=Salibacterium salarium TaxID=284579 RepID=UPI00278ADD87|nr:LysE family translocator [Salibacterium salarium]MDQ0300162.1 threonine/homoserine/homoserine lactone efflux protein [Salibacterium salarium]